MVALAEHVDQRHWTVRSGDHIYNFRRRSWSSSWSSRDELWADEVQTGTIRNTGGWAKNIEADLPGMPLLEQILSVIVHIFMVVD